MIELTGNYCDDICIKKDCENCNKEDLNYELYLESKEDNNE